MTSEHNKLLSAIGYVPFLCFLPIYLVREDDFAQFHGKQSLVLLVTYIIVSLGLWIISLIFGNILGHILLIGIVFKLIAWLSHNLLGTIAGIIYLVLIVMGFIHAISGSSWEIPTISTYAKNLKI
jgi:uncharacterized membrane protein